MKQSSVLYWLRKRIKKRLPALITLVIINAVMALLGVAFALGTKNIVNAAVSAKWNNLLQASCLQLSVIVAIIVALTLQRYLHSRLHAELDRDWKKKLAHRILHGDYARITEVHSGELLNRLNNDVRAVDDGLLTVLPGLASMVTRLVAVLITLLVLEPMLTLLLLLVGIIVIVATGVARRYLRELNPKD